MAEKQNEIILINNIKLRSLTCANAGRLLDRVNTLLHSVTNTISN